MAHNGILADWLKNIFAFNVENGDYYGNGKLPRVGKGQFLVLHTFNRLANV